MQSSVEKISNIERRISITVPAEQVEQAFTKQIDQLAKKANLKGFRPGKAPLDFIKQRFGEEAWKEALSEVIQRSLYDAIKEHNLKPVSVAAPTVEPKATMQNQPLEFVATIEVLPEIEKVNLSLTHLEKLLVDVKPEDVDYVLKQLQKQYTKWNVVDRPAQLNDRIIIDYHAVYEGEADTQNKVQKFPLELGSKVMLPGFEEGLVGVKAGDERTLNLTFPADFNIQDRAGKPIDFIVHVKQVLAADMIAIDEDFVKKLGVVSGKEEDLRKQIQDTLELERDRLVKEKLKEQIFTKMLEQNPIDVPKSLVARESKNIHDEIYTHQHDHHQHSDEELSNFDEIAKKRVALGLLIAEYSKQANIKADKARLLDRIKEIASVYENPKEVVEWLSSGDRLAGIEAQVLEDQVMEKLMEGVSLTEKTLSYSELKGINT